MDAHDNFRRIMDERAALISDCRTLGAVDLEIVRGTGFEAKHRARQVNPGHASGQYIGNGLAEELYYSRAKREH